MSISRQEARELMNRGYELGAKVLNGTLKRQEDGSWTLDERPLDDWLAEVGGEQVVLILAGVALESGGKRVCPVCGASFDGYECPNCRRARSRLRR